MGGLGEVHALLGQQAHVLGPPGLAHRLPRRITVPLEHPAAGPCPVVMVARGHLILPAVGQVLQRSLELADSPRQRGALAYAPQRDGVVRAIGKANLTGAHPAEFGGFCKRRIVTGRCAIARIRL